MRSSSAPQRLLPTTLPRPPSMTAFITPEGPHAGRCHLFDLIGKEVADITICDWRTGVPRRRPGQGRWRSSRAKRGPSSAGSPRRASLSPLAQPAFRRQTPKVGAGCGKPARPDLCGGCSAMTIPTAILHPTQSIGKQTFSPSSRFQPNGGGSLGADRLKLPLNGPTRWT